MSLPTVTPMGPMPVGMAQQPLMVFGIWVFMEYQVSVPHYYFIPVAGTVSCFTQPSFRPYVYGVPGFLRYTAY